MKAHKNKFTAEETRKIFISFFEQQNHQEWKSSSVVPYNDPSLLFINSGMNQFKPLFLGQTIESSPMAQLKRAANSQKCIRAGGKHNDLDDVGKDLYHHTFFEMLGSWSFKDYFKKDAIDLAWKLLVENFKINPDRLYVTYFGGDPKQPDCPPDLETKDFWMKYLPQERILPFGMKDNFWEMADTGPCGPCSEIHYDRIGNRDASYLVNADDPNVLEIWNLVFMQFNRDESGKLKLLPAPCVDTGMGFERLLSVLQDVNSNYDTDLFVPIFEQIQNLLQLPQSYQGRLGDDDIDKIDMSYRVIADHIRCLTVAISDGAMPSNLGRGYVLRKIIRRALRYGHQFLNAPSNKPWLFELVDSVVLSLGNYFTELNENIQKVKNIIHEEEISFENTLSRGTEHFKKILSTINRIGNPNKIFPAAAAFTLQSSFGFPLDLTFQMIEENDLKIDMIELEKLQEEHKLISQSKKSAKSIFRGFGINEVHHLNNNLKISTTNDIFKYDYNNSDESYPESFSATIVGIYADDFLTNVPENLTAIILDKTCFYSEQGGQVSDKGVISSVDGMFILEEVKSFGGYVLHIGYLTSGQIKLGDKVQLSLDCLTRKKIAINHTATHTLGFALRNITGSECSQKGSHVDSERLRFDFEFDTEDQADVYMSDIQNYVNKMIKDDLAVYTQEVNLNSANKIVGVRAIFEETYPDPVRVVSIGKDIQQVLIMNQNDRPGYKYSIEFCAGTHIPSLKQMNNFVIMDHSSIAKGIRRIVAYTDKSASQIIENDKKGIEYINYLETLEVEKLEYINNLDDIKSLSGLVFSHLTRSNLNKRINALSKKQIAYSKKLYHKIEEDAIDYAKSLLKNKANEKWIVEDVSHICPDANVKLLEKILKVFNSHNLAVYFISAGKQNLQIVCSVPKFLVEQNNISAVEWINFSLQGIGKGGGGSLKAHGGSRSIENIHHILNLANDYAIKNLNS